MRVTCRSRILLLAALAAMLPAVVTAQQRWQADRLTFTRPATIATIEGDDLRGVPSRLAWSPDGSELYFQTLEGGFGKPAAKLRHFVITVSNGVKRETQIEPEWAAVYWTAKSGQASPDDPAFKIELKSEQRTERAASVPMGGDLARGGVTTARGTSNEDAVLGAMNSQVVFLNTMLLHGETVGFFENTVIVPGLTFGWGPEGSKIIAYAAKNGRVVAMDAGGTKQEVDGSRDALLPAWSADGSALAWLQRDGRRKYLLQVSRVAAS